MAHQSGSAKTAFNQFDRTINTQYGKVAESLTVSNRMFPVIGSGLWEVEVIYRGQKSIVRSEAAEYTTNIIELFLYNEGLTNRTNDSSTCLLTVGDLPHDGVSTPQAGYTDKTILEQKSEMAYEYFSTSTGDWYTYTAFKEEIWIPPNKVGSLFYTDGTHVYNTASTSLILKWRQLGL